MAEKAVIGSLRVDLGLNTAQFTTGLKAAQGDLSKFGRLAGLGLVGLTAAAAGAATALGIMVKGAINSADDLSKLAAKSGVTTEALSRLKFAGDFADVSLEQLSGGLQRLARNMADVASGKGGSAGTALSALGVSVKDAAGNLRNSDAVFTDIAEKFSKLENGSTKSALAIQLFGRSGADLIPLLNEGREGLKRFADESDRTGNTLSTESGLAAEHFNDTLTTLQKTFEGLILKVATAALPALQDFADLLASPEFQQSAEKFGTTMVEVLSAITQAIVGAINAARDLADYLNGDLGKISDAELEKRIANSKRILADPGNRGADMTGVMKSLEKEQAELSRRKFQDPAGNGASFGQLGQFGGMSPPPDLPVFGDAAAAAATASRLQAFRESLMTEEQYEIESHAKRLEELQGFYESGAILKGEYDGMLEAEQQQHGERMSELVRQQVEEESRIRQAILGNVAGIFGSLATIAENANKENLGIAKAFGVAQVVVSTAAGIMKAFEQTGIGGWVSAAAIAAEGLAQISTIVSAQPGSSGGATVGGGGAATSSAAVAPRQNSGLTIDLTGLSPTSLYSGEQVAGILNGLKEYLGVQGQELAINYKGA